MTKLILDACNNHLGSKRIQEQMITEASKYAEYIKFQLYDIANLNPKYPNFIEVQSRMEEAQIDILRLKWIIELCRYADIMPMFTIYNRSRIGDLQINSNSKFAIKIASPDLSNEELINQVLNTFPGREIFISTGMHTPNEIEEIRVNYASYKNIKWLYCVSNYPTRIIDVDFSYMQFFDGFSDHTIGLDAIRQAILCNRNLKYVEKHFTLSLNLPIVDKQWSVEPEELIYLRSILNIRSDGEKYKNRWVV